ncbi:unnamed protein product [Phaedon cochleariae]|uniref:UBC core domain-containing protein n=1 Tax=Phaedon cochleariae TaxID=80249 RepID=A0A9P0D7A3_PHACE|nr:unnamed protein product [Phaedon cochleariae]
MSNTEKAEKVKEFYTNDIVYRFDKHKRVVIGVVVNSINSYEAAPDVDEYQALQKGQIRVLWSNTSREQVWKQNKVRLMSRNIIPGDIVRRLEKGKETQRGYCKEATQVATVQIVGTDKVIEHIPDDRLHNVRPYSIDDAVCLGSKFGRIEGVDQMVSMQSKCGSIVQVLTSINHDLDDHWLSKRNRLSFEPFYQYYPGQELVCIPSSLEQAHWIKKTKTMKRNMQARQRFTVQSVEDVLIEIAWYTNSSGYAHLSEIPPEDIKKLKVLEHPSDNFLELSDRRLFKLSAADVLLKKKDWIRKLSLMYRADVSKMRYVIYSNPRLPKVRSASLAYAPLEPMPVAPVKPKEQEEEQREIGGEEEEEEEEWWTEEAEESDDGNSSSTRIAYSPSPRKRHYPPKPKDLVPGHTLPVEVICVESKVTVVWQDGTEEKDIPSTQLYYSISLDDHEFFPGEWVVSDNAKDESDKYGVVQSVNYLERTAKIKWFTYSETKKVPEELAINEMSVYDLKKHSKFVFRPRSIVKSKPDQDEKLGKVIDSCIEGYVKVKWIDGLEERCWPQDIELIPDTDDYSFSDEESTGDEAGAGSSWETESIESYAGDLSDETALQNVAARLDFVRNRVVFMREAFKQHTISENFSFLKDLLLVYENSSYLDKLLGTAFFSLKSKHFQALLHQAKEKAKSLGVDLRGRLFSSDNMCPSISRIKVAEKENMNKMIKLENRINAQIEKKEGKEPLAPSTPLTPDSTEVPYISQENLCVELLSMLKIRMDLAYAEIISRIGGPQAFSVLTKASEQVAPTPFSSTPLPSCPTTPDESFSALSPWRAGLGAGLADGTVGAGQNEPYAAVEDAPRSHHYYGAKFEPTDLQRFLKAVQREYKLLKESLPSGVWVRSYGNRIDLLSVMIEGPAKTPYEDGLFLFDIQLSIDYPRSPPLVHYISYSTERLNPNLYVEGKVCVSLLGTWMGRGTEVWGPNSTLLQLIVSIQGLILVAEPYYNEAGYEKQNDTQQGIENARTYNELVILKLVQSMKELLRSPPEVFKAEIYAHFARNGQKLCDRLNRYCNETDPSTPDFALLPVSKGLKLSLTSALAAFREALTKIGDKSGDTPKESI